MIHGTVSTKAVIREVHMTALMKVDSCRIEDLQVPIHYFSYTLLRSKETWEFDDSLGMQTTD